MPRDGDNEFQTATFDGYRRNAWIDYLVVFMYGKGISTMNMAEILEVHAKSESLIPDPVLNGCPLPDEKVPVSGEIPRSSYIHTWKIGFGTYPNLLNSRRMWASFLSVFFILCEITLSFMG